MTDLKPRLRLFATILRNKFEISTSRNSQKYACTFQTFQTNLDNHSPPIYTSAEAYDFRKKWTIVACPFDGGIWKWFRRSCDYSESDMQKYCDYVYTTLEFHIKQDAEDKRTQSDLYTHIKQRNIPVINDLNGHSNPKPYYEEPAPVNNNNEKCDVQNGSVSTFAELQSLMFAHNSDNVQNNVQLLTEEIGQIMTYKSYKDKNIAFTECSLDTLIGNEKEFKRNQLTVVIAMNQKFGGEKAEKNNEKYNGITHASSIEQANFLWHKPDKQTNSKTKSAPIKKCYTLEKSKYPFLVVQKVAETGKTSKRKVNHYQIMSTDIVNHIFDIATDEMTEYFQSLYPVDNPDDDDDAKQNELNSPNTAAAEDNESGSENDILYTESQNESRNESSVNDGNESESNHYTFPFFPRLIGCADAIQCLLDILAADVALVTKALPFQTIGDIAKYDYEDIIECIGNAMKINSNTGIVSNEDKYKIAIAITVALMSLLSYQTHKRTDTTDTNDIDMEENELSDASVSQMSEQNELSDEIVFKMRPIQYSITISKEVMYLQSENEALTQKIDGLQSLNEELEQMLSEFRKKESKNNMDLFAEIEQFRKEENRLLKLIKTQQSKMETMKRKRNKYDDLCTKYEEKKWIKVSEIHILQDIHDLIGKAKFAVLFENLKRVSDWDKAMALEVCHIFEENIDFYEGNNQSQRKRRRKQ